MQSLLVLVKSDNPIKIYQVPWVNSPGTEAQLRDTEGAFLCKEITKKH